MLNKVMNVVGTALNSVEKMTEYKQPRPLPRQANGVFFVRL